MAEEPTLETVQTELAAAKARISELNQENAGHRLNAKNEKTRADDLAGKLETVQREAGEKLAAAEKQLGEKDVAIKQTRLDAGLRLAAKEAGIRDLDGLKLLDISKVEVAEDGSVKIPDKFFEQAKTAKPWLFGEPNTTRTDPPPKSTDKPTSYLDAKPDDYEAAKAAFLKT